MPQALTPTPVATKIDSFKFDTGQDRLELSEVLAGVECEEHIHSMFQRSMAPGKGVLRGRILIVGDEELNFHGILVKMGANRSPFLTPMRLGALHVRSAFKPEFGESLFERDCRNVFFAKGAGGTISMLTFELNGVGKLGRVQAPYWPDALRRGDRVMWIN